MGTDTYVGERVHELMWRQKVQQRQVYEAIGLSRSSLAKKMRGQIGWSLDELMIVSRLLGVTPNDLLPRLDSNQQPVGLRFAARMWRRLRMWAAYPPLPATLAATR